MGAGPLARGALAALALAPAVAWVATPAAPIVAVVAGAVAIAAALHGLGRGVGALTGDPDAPIELAIAWGLAAYLAIGGALVAIGAFGHAGQRVVLIAGTAIGAAWCERRGADLLPRRPPITLAMLLPALTLAVVGFHVVAAAGTWQGRFSDGEVFHLGALARLDATGALRDGFGVPRTSGLGGNLLVSALAGVFDDWRAVHAIDRGVMFGLALAVALGGLRRGPMRIAIGFAMVTLASAAPEYAADLAPRWTIVALVFALYRSLGRARAADRTPWAALLLAGALATLQHGGFGLALVVAIDAVHAAPRGATRRRALAGSIAILAAATAGLALAAALARAHAPAAAAIVGPGTPARLALWSVAAAVVFALLRLAVRELGDRALTTTIAALCAAAAVTGAQSSSAAQTWQLVQPYGIALVFLLFTTITTLASPRGFHPLTAAILLLVALALATTRFPIGWPPIAWQTRLGRMTEAARALATVGPGDDRADRAACAAALARIPRGARVGLWIDRGDVVEDRAHALVDVRTGATAACGDDVRWKAGWSPRPTRACAALAATLPRLDLDYLVVSPAIVRRAGTGGPLCRLMARPTCADPIAAFVAGAPDVSGGDLAVYRLR